MSEHLIKDIRVVRQSIYHFDERSGPCGNEKVGISINNEVIWIGSHTYPSSGEGRERYNNKERIANYIVSLVNNGLCAKDAVPDKEYTVEAVSSMTQEQYKKNRDRILKTLTADPMKEPPNDKPTDA